MTRMTAEEIYKSIASKSGVNIEIVKRVIGAEREYALEALARGETAALMGRCNMTAEPYMDKEFDAYGRVVDVTKVRMKIKPSSSFQEELGNMVRRPGEEEVKTENLGLNFKDSIVLKEHVVTRQIEGLL